jgi:hypothetical protein
MIGALDFVWMTGHPEIKQNYFRIDQPPTIFESGA